MPVQSAEDGLYEPDSARVLNQKREQAPEEKKAEPAKPQEKKLNFQLGNLNEPTSIPSTFGPFTSRSTGVGIYRGMLRVQASDITEKMYLVVRVQNDKDHRFGWLRCFVGNQLVANESSLKDNRIVEDVSRWLKPGDTLVTIMGSAYPGTNMDFYIVPKDTVLSVLQGKPLDNVVYSTGAMSAAGKNNPSFEKSFDISDPEKQSSRMVLTTKAMNSKGKPFAWCRVSLNGTMVLSEQNFLAGEASVDVSNMLKSGRNRIELQAASAPETVYGCFVTKLSRLNLPVPGQKSQLQSAGQASTNKQTAPSKTADQSGARPLVTRVNPVKDIKAGSMLELWGKGFEKAIGQTRIYFDDKFCSPAACSNTEIKVEVPSNLHSGPSRLVVAVGELRSEPITLNVIGVPMVSGSSPSQVRPGRELEISGENFSENRSDVQVELSGHQAKVLSSTRQRIIVLVPEMPLESGELSLKVSVAGMQAINELKLRVSDSI